MDLNTPQVVKSIYLHLMHERNRTDSQNSYFVSLAGEMQAHRFNERRLAGTWWTRDADPKCGQCRDRITGRLILLSAMLQHRVQQYFSLLLIGSQCGLH